MTNSLRPSAYIAVQILWIVAPIILAEPFGVLPILNWLSTSTLGPAPFVLVLLVGLELLAIAALHWQKIMTKQIFKRIFFGWMIQSLGIALLWMLASGFEPNVLLVVGILAILLLGVSLITLFAYLGIKFLGKNKTHPFFQSEWLPVCVLFGLALLWLVSLHYYELSLQGNGLTLGYRFFGGGKV